MLRVGTVRIMGKRDDTYTAGICKLYNIMLARKLSNNSKIADVISIDQSWSLDITSFKQLPLLTGNLKLLF